MNDLYYYGALDLMNYAMTKTYLEDLSRIITPDTQIRFNKKNHRLYMDIDAPRASKTSLEAPGGINIKCGQDKSRPDVTFNIQVENGKLALTCQTGDVEILGKNVTIEAKGDGTNDGAITLKSNSKIALNSPKVEINPKQKFEINSEQKIGFSPATREAIIGRFGDFNMRYGIVDTDGNR